MDDDISFYTKALKSYLDSVGVSVEDAVDELSSMDCAVYASPSEAAGAWCGPWKDGLPSDEAMEVLEDCTDISYVYDDVDGTVLFVDGDSSARMNALNESRRGRRTLREAVDRAEVIDNLESCLANAKRSATDLEKALERVKNGGNPLAEGIPMLYGSLDLATSMTKKHLRRLGWM